MDTALGIPRSEEKKPPYGQGRDEGGGNTRGWEENKVLCISVISGVSVLFPLENNSQL